MSTIQEMKAINVDNSSDNQEAAPFCRLVPAPGVTDITARHQLPGSHGGDPAKNMGRSGSNSPAGPCMIV